MCMKIVYYYSTNLMRVESMEYYLEERFDWTCGAYTQYNWSRDIGVHLYAWKIYFTIGTNRQHTAFIRSGLADWSKPRALQLWPSG